MLSIVWMLFVAWFLNLFGLGDLFVRGAAQLWGIKLTLASYYFIFAAAGLIKNILYILKRNTILDWTEELDKK